MGDTHIDPAVFKAQQREQWSNVAQGWRRRWAAFEQGAQPLSDRMMNLAHVAPGQRVLDVATGIGEPAMTAARLVGPSGSVVAIDQAPQMLAVARERMQAAGIRTADIRGANIGGLAAMAAGPGWVDVRPAGAALLNPQLPFAAAFPKGARERRQQRHRPRVGRHRRLLGHVRPRLRSIGGGREVRRSPLGRLSYSNRSETPSIPSGPSPFALSEPTRLEQVLRDAGFANVQSEPFTVTFEFASVDELLGHLGEVSAPIRMIMATSSPEYQAEFWKKLADAAVPFTDADGRIRLSNDCLVAAGQR